MAVLRTAEIVYRRVVERRVRRALDSFRERIRLFQCKNESLDKIKYSRLQ
jgi:hypothetical protein